MGALWRGIRGADNVRNTKPHAGSAILLVAVLSVAVALGIQDHNDRVLSAQVAQSESKLRTLGAQIAAIKDHQFRTMDEYIAAYARVEPVLKEYDQSED